MNTNLNNPETSEELLKRLLKDPLARSEAARKSHLLFFLLYFQHYAKYRLAKFQRSILALTENAHPALLIFVAFRGSGKSTLVTLSYSLWSILGVQNKKYVLIVCQTYAQARQQMLNLKDELENNGLLRSDMGPFREEPSGEWSIGSLVFRNTGARIMIASVEQSIRGLRHKQYRPDLIILDDIEDYLSTRTKESRDKTFEWFTREVVPLGDIGTRIVIVANFLHEDSLVARLRRMMDAGEIDGIYRWFPIVDKNGLCLWPEKFDSSEKIEELRRGTANELAWRHEYLLEAVSDSSRAVHPEWIHYYDELPPPDGTSYHVVAVDLAIAKDRRSDYTAMVIARVFGNGENLRVYILPNPVHIKADFPTVVQGIKDLSDSISGRKEILVENVGFQEAYVQQLQHDGYTHVHEMKPLQRLDKYGRIVLASPIIQDGRMRFARRGNEELLAELTDIGSEQHDDLADAVGMIGLYLLHPKPGDEYRGLLDYYKEDTHFMNQKNAPEKPVFRISDVVGRINWPPPL